MKSSRGAVRVCKAFRLAASSHALLADIEGDERAKARVELVVFWFRHFIYCQAVYLAGLTKKIIQAAVWSLEQANRQRRM